MTNLTVGIYPTIKVLTSSYFSTWDIRATPTSATNHGHAIKILH